MQSSGRGSCHALTPQKTWEVERKMSGAVDFISRNNSSTTALIQTASTPTYVIPEGRLRLTPLRLCIWMGRALLHIRNLRDVLHFLAGIPLFSEMVQRNPRFAFKFLIGDYLAKGFSISECAACFLHHYKSLHKMLPNHLLRQILQEEVALHVFPEGGDRFTLTLGLSRPYDNEGELTLRLRVDGDIVFVLAFTVVPGWVVKSPADDALLITRLQGIKGRYRQIAIATKALHDVAPSRLLLAALQGIAGFFGISAIAAVPAEKQNSYKKDADLKFKNAYDNLFTELGLSKDDGGFFSSAVPIDHKPILSIKRGHRLRAKRKREFKHRVQLACSSFFANYAGNRAMERSKERTVAQLPRAWPVSATPPASTQPRRNLLVK